MHPKVSVIIAAHDHAHFLPECLGSVRVQTYHDYEVIVVDNGSTDNTRETVERFSWDKLRYHYQKNTGSVAGPRNTGIKLAKGDYVAFLDSDDLWYPEKLEKVMAILISQPAIDVVSHDLVTRTNGIPGQLLQVGPQTGDLFRQLLLGNCVLGSATVAKRSVMLEIGGFDENKGFIHVEDYETWLRLSYLKKKFFFLNETLGEYRIHQNNLSHDFRTAFDNEFRVVEKHFKNYRSRYLLDKGLLHHRSLGKIFLRLSLRHFQQKKYNIGAGLFMKAFFYDPLFITRFSLGAAKMRIMPGRIQ